MNAPLHTHEILDLYLRIEALMVTLGRAETEEDIERLELAIADALDEIDGSLDERLDRLIYVSERASLEASEKKAEAASWTKAQRRDEAVAERTKRFAEQLLRRDFETGGDGRSSGRRRARLQGRGKRLVAPDSIEAWPHEWRKQPAEQKQAAVALKALKAGESFPGFDMIDAPKTIQWIK